MAAEMISSAVVGETLNRVVSRLLTGSSHGEDDRCDGIRGSLERLIMAHSRMEAVLELSTRWPITDVSLLRWRRRLKRAAEECDGALRRRRKQRAVEDEAASRSSSSSFPRRVAHATRSFVSALIGGRGEDDSSSSSAGAAAAADVRRFETFADGAREFLKLVELGGTRPRQHAFFHPLIGRLLEGETLSYLAQRGSKFYYLGVRPLSFEERGVEAAVGFVVQDFVAPARSFKLGLMMRLSERTDVLGTMIDCIQSATPTSHFRVVAEDVRRELAQLPTQDFTWVASSPYGHNKYWVDVHSTLTWWYRPNPLCCTDHRRHSRMIPSSFGASLPSSTYPEQIIVVHLQCYIPSPLTESPNDLVDKDDEQPPPLKLTVLFIPHDHDNPKEEEEEEEEEEGMKHLSSSYGHRSYALEVIDEEEPEQHTSGACQLQDLDERLLPKAVDHLRSNAASRKYQVCLRSGGHGAAHICVEKTAAVRASEQQRGSQRAGGRRRSRRSKTESPWSTRAVAQRRGESEAVEKRRERYSIEGWRDQSARELLKLWVVRASEKLHGSVSSWTTATEATLLGD